MFHPYFQFTNGPTPTPPTPTPGGGGGAGGGGWYPKTHAYGRANWRKKKWDQQVTAWVDASASEMYADLTASDMPKAVRKEAAALVRPFSESKGIPNPQVVDWDALAADASAVLELLSLWRREADDRDILDDDDDILMSDFL